MAGALQIIDGQTLGKEYRSLLKPGEQVDGKVLPRYFYKVPDWETALRTPLTEHFNLYEFLVVDLYEHELMQAYPRYVPCAVTLLAFALESVRVRIGKPIHIAANGGYRSPVHRKNTRLSAHSFGAAANLYRIGEDFLNDKDTIESYSSQIEKATQGIWEKKFGHEIGESDDHLHFDIGFTVVTPSSEA